MLFVSVFTSLVFDAETSPPILLVWVVVFIAVTVILEELSLTLAKLELIDGDELALVIRGVELVIVGFDLELIRLGVAVVCEDTMIGVFVLEKVALKTGLEVAGAVLVDA